MIKITIPFEFTYSEKMPRLFRCNEMQFIYLCLMGSIVPIWKHSAAICRSITTSAMNFSFETKVLLQLQQPENLSSYNLTILYEWRTMGAHDIDGLLYRVMDIDQRSQRNQNNMSARTPKHLHKDKCERVAGQEVWVARNSTETHCTLPCNEYFDKACRSDDLCSLLDDGFRTLKKSQRSLFIHEDLRFGRKYELDMRPYRGRIVGDAFEIPETEPVFCRDKFISEWNVTTKKADEVCEQVQDIAGMSLASSPPARLHQNKAEVDLPYNKAKIVFSWKAPYDISDKVNLTSFAIHASQGIPDRKKVGAGDHDEDFTYSVTVYRIPFFVEGSIEISPIFECLDGLHCNKVGKIAHDIFFVEELDACKAEVNGSRFCQINATCKDLSANNSKPANCVCPEGELGNGINKVIFNGDGCYDGCSHEKFVCHRYASCIPSKKSSKCQCGSNLIGDGYADGTGCVRMSMIVGVSIGIVIFILLSGAAFANRLRRKLYNQNFFEPTISKFVVKDNDPSGFYLNLNERRGRNEVQMGDFLDISENSIRLLEVIGRGSFGIVYKALLSTHQERKEVAVKAYSSVKTESHHNMLAGEIAIMATMGLHENVMSMIGYCQAESSSVWMVMKLMKYGDLLHFLWSARDVPMSCTDPIYDMREKDLLDISKQCAGGLDYLTRVKILHGDVAARNILVDEGLQCKISDFGLANDIYRYGKINGAKEKRVPLKWISPERMLDGAVPITWKSDVWSFGVLLYEITTLGACPYPGIRDEELFLKLKAGERMLRPETCDLIMYKTMLQCWEWQPSKRPSFNEIVVRIKKVMSGVRSRGRLIAPMIRGVDGQIKIH